MNQTGSNIKSLHSKKDVNDFIENLSFQLMEEFARNISSGDLLLIGIQTRGVTLAKRIQKVIRKKTGQNLPVGSLGTTLYRDDIGHRSEAKLIKPTELEFSVDNKTVILIDDVLYSGRTIRAAINEIMDFGRPKMIRLLVLVDRCCRELPIQSDYFAKIIQIKGSGKIRIRFEENDPELGDGIFLEEN